MFESKLKKWLTDADDFEKRGAKVFPQIDDDKLVRDLEVRERGAEDGKANIPAADTSQFSSMELRIQSRFDEFAQKYVTDHDHLKTNYAASIRSFNEEIRVDSVANEEREQLNHIVADAKARLSHLYAMQEKVKASASELWAFRSQHGLKQRTPEGLPPNSHLLRTAILFLFIVGIELAISVFLLRESNGLLMVVMTAVIYCILNAGVPFSVALIWGKWANYAPTEFEQRRKIGYLVRAGLICVGLFVNLMLAHLREQSTVAARAAAEAVDQGAFELAVIQALNSSARAWESLLASPFSFSETFTILMLLVGFGLFIFAVYDGLHFHDSYPQYHSKAMKFLDSYYGYETAMLQTINAIKHQRSAYVKGIDDSKRLLKDAIKRAKKRADSYSEVSLRCRSAIETLRLKYIRVIREYRETNLSARSEAAPSYFDVEPQFPEYKLFAPSCPDVEEEAVNKKIELLSTFANDAHSKFEDLILQVPTAESLVAENYPLRVDV